MKEEEWKEHLAALILESQQLADSSFLVLLGVLPMIWQCATLAAWTSKTPAVAKVETVEKKFLLLPRHRL